MLCVAVKTTAHRTLRFLQVRQAKVKDEPEEFEMARS